MNSAQGAKKEREQVVCLSHLLPPLTQFNPPPLFTSLSLQSIFTFEQLTELDLSENVILFLPPSIRSLRSLTSLNISKNSERTPQYVGP
jgi:Leucine-rich repeat (LRR) protein